MIMSILYKELRKHHITCTDEKAGKVQDVLFSDRTFKIKYFGVDTSNWLLGHKVALAEESIEEFRELDHVINLNIKKSVLENAPALDEMVPVSRQYEMHVRDYFGWKPLGAVLSPEMGAWFPYPNYELTSNVGAIPQAQIDEWSEIQVHRKHSFDGHLRSCNELLGYKIATSDGEHFGEVADLMIDVVNFQVIDILISTNRWLPGGKKFACSPMFIRSIDEENKYLNVGLSKDILLNSPEFTLEEYGEDYRQSLVESYCNVDDSFPSSGADHRPNSGVSQAGYL